LFGQIEYCFNFTYLMLHSGGVSKRTTQTAKSGGTSFFIMGMSVGSPPMPAIPSQGFPLAFVWSAATEILIGFPSPAKQWAGHSKMSKTAQKDLIRAGTSFSSRFAYRPSFEPCLLTGRWLAAIVAAIAVHSMMQSHTIGGLPVVSGKACQTRICEICSSDGWRRACA
jgi:hypothetical protein